MGGTYSSPKPEKTSQVLQDYTQYLPSLLSATSSTLPASAQGQLNATLATQPIYDALNLNEAQRYSVPLAQVGQDVQRSNALAGAATNVAQLTGAGRDAALAATDVARASNPDYYGVQDAASSQARNLVNSINLGGLSRGEQAAVERSLNQSNYATGNLGIDNATNAVSNAMNFGNALQSKRDALGNALGVANQTATSAQNTGFNPVNIALGQPNTSTMGNFGTGTFAPSNASTGNANAGNVYGFGSSLLGAQSSMNNAATAGAYGLAQANAIPNYIPNISL